MSSPFDPEIRAFLARSATLSGWPLPTAPSLPAQIAAWITDRIQFGDLKPGEPIRELAVAEHFDVSRGPVRDALRLLDRDGLVVINGRKGAAVRGFSSEETTAVARIRAELFGALSSLAASADGRDQAAVDALGEGAALLVKLAQEPAAPVGDYITVRRGISRLIAGLAGNEYMAALSSAMEREVAVLWASVLHPDRRRRSAAIWTDLCRAVAVGRAGEAERLGRELVLDGLAEMQRRSAESAGAGA